MEGEFKAIVNAVGMLFKSKRQLAITLISSIFMFFLAFIIPILLIPSNTLKLQLSLLSLDSAVLLFLFSILFGISIGLLTHPIKNYESKNVVFKGTGTTLASFTGILFATKLCPICLGSILGFMGLGGSTLFLLSYRNEILIISMIFLLLSIYMSAKRLSGYCKNCKT